MDERTAEVPAPEQPAREASGSRCNRRGALAALAGMTGLAAGAALGYKFRFKIEDLRGLHNRPASGAQDSPTGGDRDDFLGHARQIAERHRQQTAESVAALKAKYEKPVFGKVVVWDL